MREHATAPLMQWLSWRLDDPSREASHYQVRLPEPEAVLVDGGSQVSQETWTAGCKLILKAHIMRISLILLDVVECLVHQAAGSSSRPFARPERPTRLCILCRRTRLCQINPSWLVVELGLVGFCVTDGMMEE